MHRWNVLPSREKPSQSTSLQRHPPRQCPAMKQEIWHSQVFSCVNFMLPFFLLQFLQKSQLFSFVVLFSWHLMSMAYFIFIFFFLRFSRAGRRGHRSCNQNWGSHHDRYDRRSGLRDFIQEDDPPSRNGEKFFFLNRLFFQMVCPRGQNTSHISSQRESVCVCE